MQNSNFKLVIFFFYTYKSVTKQYIDVVQSPWTPQILLQFLTHLALFLFAYCPLIAKGLPCRIIHLMLYIK